MRNSDVTKNLLFGKPLATHEEGEQRVGPLAGIPMFERGPFQGRRLSIPTSHRP
jgi:hypothetical protein